MPATTNAYLVTYATELDEYGEVVMAGFTMADVDESFARMFAEAIIVKMELISEFVTEAQPDAI
jgi:hypothetical protein